MRIEYGTQLSRNEPGEMCGGSKPLFTCGTVQELAKKAMDINTESARMDGWTCNGDMSPSCLDCGLLPGVSVHVIAGRPTEELCFTFTDLKAREEATKDMVSAIEIEE